jgi:hypothetical protein
LSPKPEILIINIDDLALAVANGVSTHIPEELAFVGEGDVYEG